MNAPEAQAPSQTQAPEQASTPPATPGDVNAALALAGACGWCVAALLFFVPTFYAIAVHGLALVGFASLVSGHAKTMLPNMPALSALPALQSLRASFGPRTPPHPP